MKIIFLGTNGWYSNNGRSAICTLIETDDYYLILDAGEGIKDLDKHLKDKKKPIYLFLSHLHLDHIYGFHIIIKFDLPQGITVVVPRGGKKHLDTILREPFTMKFEDYAYPMKVIEVDSGKNKEPIEFEMMDLRHGFGGFGGHGYRFNIENKIVAYTGDTGPCENLEKLAKNADILISECSMPGEETSHDWGHMNAGEVVELAKKTDVKKAVLSHLPAMSSNREIDKMREELSDIIIGKDGESVEI